MNTIILNTLNQLHFSDPIVHGAMTLVPLMGNTQENQSLLYIGLDLALKQGTLIIEEITEGGSVPDLVVINKGERDVLMVEGDHLIGAKQNRTLNTTILAPAGAKIVIPVSCVEQGRWSYRSRRFAASQGFQFARGRREKVRSVSESMKYSPDAAQASRRSDQSAVWDAIAMKQRVMGYTSPSASMDDIYEHHADSVDDYERSFRFRRGMRGAIIFAGRDVTGLDYFASEAIFEAYLPRIVRGYALDALEERLDQSLDRSLDEAASFVSQIKTANVSDYPSVGLGRDLRLEGVGADGGGLALDDELIHLSAFQRPVARRRNL